MSLCAIRVTVFGVIQDEFYFTKFNLTQFLEITPKIWLRKVILVETYPTILLRMGQDP